MNKNPHTVGGLPASLLYVLSGLLPFINGTLLGGVAGFPLRLEVFLLGAGALAALILAAICGREAYAPAAARFPAWRFLSPGQAKGLGPVLVLLAALLGVILRFGLHTGGMTLPLGVLGIFGSFGYFAPPLKLGPRGVGEALGALCLGLAPVLGGFYLQCGHLVTEPLFYGLPLTFAAFNLLLVHGFPNPEAEAPAGRGGLAGRLRPVTAALVYTLANLLVIAGLVFDLLFPATPLPFRGGFIILIILAVASQEVLKKRAYLREKGVRLWCRLTLAQHLGMGLVFSISLWLR